MCCELICCRVLLRYRDAVAMLLGRNDVASPEHNNNNGVVVPEGDESNNRNAKSDFINDQI